MKKKSIGIFLMFCFLSFFIIFSYEMGIPQRVMTTEASPFEKFSPVGIKVKHTKFRTVLGVPESVSKKLEAKYKKVELVGDLPFYSLPSMEDAVMVFKDSNDSLDATLRWLIQKVNKLEERIKILEEQD